MGEQQTHSEWMQYWEGLASMGFSRALTPPPALVKTEEEEVMSNFAVALDEVVETLDRLRPDTAVTADPEVERLVLETAVSALWEKVEDGEEARAQAVIIAALALHFILECCENPEEEKDD